MNIRFNLDLSEKSKFTLVFWKLGGNVWKGSKDVASELHKMALMYGSWLCFIFFPAVLS